MGANIHPVLKALIPVVEGVAKTFGKNCEVVLHDFTNLPSSIISIENGHVTGRSVGSPMTEVGLQAIRKGDMDGSILNYTGKSTDGRALKSSTMFIKDEKEKVIGCFCINFDISELVVSQNALAEIIQTEEKEDVKTKDNQSNCINDVLSNIVTKTLEELGKPVAYMNKDEKVNIVKKLDDQGAFLIKGAIDYVAKVLCVSRYTIYNYLDEIRVSDK